MIKLAVFSDVHGNLPALQTTLEHIERWQADCVVVNGDIVNRGPRSRECWELLASRKQRCGWTIVRGNHEDYVASWLDEDFCVGEAQFEIDQSAHWTFQTLEEQMSTIVELPEQVTVRADDGRAVRVTHGSMRGNRDGIYMSTPDDELQQQIVPAPAVFCTAHTHRPLIRELNGTLVVNSGSAGTAFDGDPRISYAQLVWRHGCWRAEIVRLKYDRQWARRDFEMSGYLDGGGPLVEIFLQEWELARPLVNRWAATYAKAVRDGDMALRQSVDAFLRAAL